MSGVISDGTFSGIVEYIQTDNTITVSFKIPHDLPSYSTTDNTYPKIVIIMPKAMRKGKSDINILNLDGSMENWLQGREEQFVYTTDVASADLPDCRLSDWVCFFVKPIDENRLIPKDTTLRF